MRDGCNGRASQSDGLGSSLNDVLTLLMLVDSIVELLLQLVLLGDRLLVVLDGRDVLLAGDAW